jgi:hypothetical protein
LVAEEEIAARDSVSGFCSIFYPLRTIFSAKAEKIGATGFEPAAFWSQTRNYRFYAILRNLMTFENISYFPAFQPYFV